MTKKKPSYLVLHHSGAIIHTNTLTNQEPIEGITAIINLNTLEQYVGGGWEKLPTGYETLIEAEKNIQDGDSYEEEYYEEDEEEFIPAIQTGARRFFNPHIIWSYATHNFNAKRKN